tara:strand:+ start:531 stop:998 length:468 start_codon:yes stop_codon:yes gene_type:complete
MSIPTDLMAQASAIGAQEEMIEEAVLMQPQGKFSAGALNRLVKELNVVLEMFGETYPEFEEDITIFPQEFVQSLNMVVAAADDAGVEFEIDMEEITDDRDLAMVAGQLRKLAKDKTLQKFLQENTMVEEEIVEEETVEEEPVMEVDINEMFAGRM